MLVAGLSTGHKIGLLVVALVFIAFALVSSFVLPRRDPDFPGRGATVYYFASVVLFAAMLAAVAIFGVESEEGSAAAAETQAGGQGQTSLDVVESEWRVTLPAATAQKPGVYVFHVVNKGKLAHNLTVNGPAVANAHTPTIAPGGSADLKVTLESGRYDVYCSIPGHKEQGMDAKLSVG